jgi:hypothetical protein
MVEAVKTNVIVSLDFDSLTGALERVKQLGPVDTRAAAYPHAAARRAGRERLRAATSAILIAQASRGFPASLGFWTARRSPAQRRSQSPRGTGSALPLQQVRTMS